MKRILLLISILFALSLTLISCGSKECEHSFAPATCRAPSTCIYCRATQGAPIPHSYMPATCKTPKKCEDCGKTEGDAIDHIFEGATCETPGVCKMCGIEDEEVAGHSWTSKLCTKDKACKVCGITQEATEHVWDTDNCEEVHFCVKCSYVGGIPGHEWEKASCVLPEHCTQCGKENGEPLGHDWKVISCKNPKVCQRCNKATTEDLPHDWQYKGCDEQRVCSVCSKKEGFVFGHQWQEATCQAAKHCESCGITEGTPTSHDWQEATCTLAKRCADCKITEGEPLGHSWQLTSTILPLCENGKEVYSCYRCKGEREELSPAKYGYHICDTDGLCLQCNNKYDTESMALESVLIENEHSVECCGIFTSLETYVSIYKPITSKDIGMPVIDLGGSLPTAKGYTNTVSFTYDSNDLSFDCVAEIKVQGASSAGKPKKNFNIKLLDADGTKNKVELVDGWGKENKYCLKANYIDYSQSRNVVSGKIFGEIVKSRNDELINTPNGGAIDGFPILVYNNGVYQGLYTLNIPKDKWMFDMHDSDEKNQAIFMTETWNNAVSFREVSTSGFVLEYASNEDSLIDNSTQWAYDSILELIRFVYNNDGEAFKNGIHEYADIDKCIDSMIYTFFICADDNTSKNILWVTLDGKVWFSSMYDMDGTWGMRWNGNIEFDEYTHPISALVDGKGLAPERNHSNLNLLWERIYVNYYDRVVERYWELRQNILTEDNITYHFVNFFNAIPDIVRDAEKEKWTGVPTQNIDHLEQILTYAKGRIEVMDKILVPNQ